VAVVRYSSNGNAICSVRYFRFVDDVTFHVIERMGQDQRRRVSSISSGGGTGCEVCRLRLHLVLFRRITIRKHQDVSSCVCVYIWSCAVQTV